MKNLRKAFGLGLSFALCLSFASCGGSNGYKDYASYEAYNSAPAATEEYSYGYDSYDSYESYEEPATGTNLETDSETNKKLSDTARKLIKTYNLSVETENFDEFQSETEKRIIELGGYVQNLDTYNGSSYSYGNTRYSRMTVRIPVNRLEEFVGYVGDNAHLKNKNLSVEDVTLSYVDTKSKKETYEIEQERLLALLEVADNVEDMITIESRLSEVRYKLESQESILRTYDNLVDYSTVYLNVDEVKKYTEPEPESYGARVARSFKDGVTDVFDGLKEFLVDFVGAFPSLVLFALIIAVIVVIIKAILKGSKKRKAKKTMERSESRMEQAKLAAKKKAQENAE